MQNKTAQALKRRHKARRLVNPTGKALMALNPAFKKVILNLDRVDKKVRKEAEDLNYFIGMSRSFFRRKDYLTAATYLTKFHEKIRLIHHQLNIFNSDISVSNRKFLLKQFKSKDKKDLFEYDPNKDIAKADDGLIATAGAIKDWWRTPGRFSDLMHNLTDRKSKSMRALERNFSVPFFSQLKSDTKEILEVTEEFYSDLIENFHRMGSAWASRNIGAYVMEIKDINDKYQEYHKLFLKYHQDNIAPMKQEQARLDQIELEENEKKQQLIKDNFPAKPHHPEPHVVKDPFPSPPSSTMGPPTPSDMRHTVKDSPSHSHSPSSTMGPPTPRDRQKAEDVESSGPITLVSPDVKEFFHTPHHKVPAAPTTKKYPFYTAPPPSSAPFSFSGPPGRHIKQDVSDLISYDPELKAKEDALKAKSHLDFINKIERLSTEGDIIREILKYSEKVEKYSEEESLKLLSIAEGMIEKNAAGHKKQKDKPESLSPETEMTYSLDPETESLTPDSPPRTQESPNMGSPKSTRINNNKDYDFLNDILPKKQYEPIGHGIPSGDVNKRWFDIPFLANKKADDIKLSSNTTNVVVKKIVKFLHHKYLPYTHIENYEGKFIKEIKKSIINGQVISNLSCNDPHNGRDCQLTVFSYISLEDLDSSPALKDVLLSFTATCRLSVFEGDITVKNIHSPKIHDSSE